MTQTKKIIYYLLRAFQAYVAIFGTLGLVMGFIPAYEIMGLFFLLSLSQYFIRKVAS